MKLHNEKQGSDEWLDLRLPCFTASEAAAMMNESKHMTRNELLRMKAAGDKKEVSDFVQKNIFDKGHEVEAKARAILEDELGVELYPVTGSIEVNGMTLLASFDGLEDDERDWSLEHKQWNKDLPAKVEAGEYDPDHYWQMEHQIVVGDLEYVLFEVSDGTTGNRVMAKYYPVEGRREELIAGWKQFEEDLANYEVKEQTVEVVGKAIQELPTLSVQLTGSVESSNIDILESQAGALLKNVRTELVTDQHFADADKIVKFCGTAEKDIKAAKKAALAQTASIDDLFRRMDHVNDQLRDTRLSLGKKVTAEKTNRKQQIIDEGFAMVNAVHAAAMAELSHEPDIASPDLKAAAKNKRSLESLENAIDSAIAAWKIEFKEACANVARNEKALNENSEFSFLFIDAREFINKDNEFVEMLITKRVNEHKEAEKAKAEAAAEKERERIRKEEEAKAKAAADAKLAEERKALEAEQKAANEKLAMEMEQVHAEKEAEQSNKADAGCEANQAAPEPALENDAPAQISGDVAASVQQDSEDPRATVKRAALKAFIDTGIDEEIAKSVIKLVATGKVPGMVMNYPEAQKAAA